MYNAKISIKQPIIATDKKVKREIIKSYLQLSNSYEHIRKLNGNESEMVNMRK